MTTATADLAPMAAPEILAAIITAHETATVIAGPLIDDEGAISRAPGWYDRLRARDFRPCPEDPYPVAARRISALIVDGDGVRTAVHIVPTRASVQRSTAAARAPWADVAHHYVFAAPVGVMDPGEIPDGCGFWEITAAGDIVTRTRPRGNPAPLPLPGHVLAGSRQLAAQG